MTHGCIIDAMVRQVASSLREKGTIPTGPLPSVPTPGIPRPLLRQIHLPQECLVAGIRCEVSQLCFRLDGVQLGLLLRISALEPMHRVVELSTKCIYVGNPERVPVGSVFDH